MYDYAILMLSDREEMFMDIFENEDIVASINMTDETMAEESLKKLQAREEELQEKEIEDIFDRIMSLKVFRFMWLFYKKNKDKLLYLFFGGCTTLVNLGITYFFWYALGWEKIYVGKFALGTFAGNLIGIVAAILFAYVTNKKYVFVSKTNGMNELLSEFFRFVGGRVSTLIIELGGVQLAAILFPDSGTLLFIAKLVTQILVVIINYFISKFLVFRGNKEE